MKKPPYTAYRRPKLDVGCSVGMKPYLPRMHTKGQLIVATCDACKPTVVARNTYGNAASAASDRQPKRQHIQREQLASRRAATSNRVVSMQWKALNVTVSDGAGCASAPDQDKRPQ